MKVSKTYPLNSQDVLFVSDDNRSTVYMLAAQGLGKSSETARQAAVKEDIILAPTNLPFKRYGIPHGDINPEIPGMRYITLYDLLQGNRFDFQPHADGAVHFCVDEGRLILEELLSQALDMPIKIDFMTLTCGDENIYER